MKKIVLIAALSAACVSASANAEGYIEARGGIAGTSGYTTETLGLALGYDVDVSSNVFVGGEVTADTNADFVTPVYGLNARAGVKIGDSDKFFGTLGVARYQFDGVIYGYYYDLYYSGWESDVVAGVGYQHKISENAHISAQYQRYFDTKYNRGMIGIGFEF